MAKVSKQNIPRHIAIIMDGNRRWARERGKNVMAGHKRVVDEILEPLVERAADLGVEQLTFWAWSTENWGRNRLEVAAIMKLFKWALKKYTRPLVEKGARVKMIGDLSGFPGDVQREFERLMDESRNNKKITVVFALNYGGRGEILRAINRLLEEKEKRKKKKEKKLSEQEFEKYLDTAGMPDPDFIIRTSGEQRLSGFLPWQGVYAELCFPEVKMPNFTVSEFEKVLEDYQKRKRRYGK